LLIGTSCIFFFFLLSCCICIIFPYCGYKIQYVFSLSERRVPVESNLNEQTSLFYLNQKENHISMGELHIPDLKVWPLFSLNSHIPLKKMKKMCKFCHWYADNGKKIGRTFKYCLKPFVNL
jgi:hypothetical protein